MPEGKRPARDEARPLLQVVGMALAVLLAGAAASSPTQSSEASQEALEKAELLLEENDYKGAIRAFKKAEKLSPKPSLRCSLGLARSFIHIGAFKNAEKTARAAVDLAQDATSRSIALNYLGISLFAGGRADDEELLEAEAAFREVLELSQGTLNNARYSLGETLLRLERDEEGVALLKHYLREDPHGPYAERARSLIKNPLRARVHLMPEFEIVTLDGEYLTSEELLGNVVLIDFWGTWCGPCVAAVPHLRTVSRKSKENPFVLLSVSSDSDENVLRSFIAENRMSWPQYWDDRHELQRLFDVRSFPTYVLVDHQGVMISRVSGWNRGLERQINLEIYKALRRAKKAAPINPD